MARISPMDRCFGRVLSGDKETRDSEPEKKDGHKNKIRNDLLERAKNNQERSNGGLNGDGARRCAEAGMRFRDCREKEAIVGHGVIDARRADHEHTQAAQNAEDYDCREDLSSE